MRKIEKAEGSTKISGTTEMEVDHEKILELQHSNELGLDNVEMANIRNDIQAEIDAFRTTVVNQPSSMEPYVLQLLRATIFQTKFG